MEKEKIIADVRTKAGGCFKMDPIKWTVKKRPIN